MVFYFTSNVSGENYTLYMVVDKHENEDLIKYGWPEDIWFHVDKYSSAHVYLRLKLGQTIEDIPPAVVEDCAQLVKANSIQGTKLNNINIVYTPWANLKKTASMAVGQVGFFKQKAVKHVQVEKKVNEIVNRLNKTKLEKHPDLAKEKEDRDAEERKKQKKQARLAMEEERLRLQKLKEEAELRSYTTLFNSEEMVSNNQGGEDSDDSDFM